ncbi:MAG: hypothetical protein CMH57_06515 [Myxococcales bacterium]|nr:hypothetical protein [Myxococcales bacterium]
MNDTPTPPAQPRRAALLASLGLALLVGALYARTVAFPFLDWDDVTHILRNRLIVEPGSVALIDLLLTPNMGYSVPALILTQAALAALSGLDPWLFHLTNVLTHGAVVTLTFLLAHRLTGRLVAAALAAALFAAHPLVAEPVAWATGLKDLLSAALALGATWSLLTWLDREPDRPRLPLAAIGLATLAMLTKPQTLPLGLAWLGMLAAVPAERRRPLGESAVVALGVGAALAAMTLIARRVLAFDDVETAQGSPLLALGVQLQHLLWPTDLHPTYLMDRASTDDPRWLAGLLALPLIGAALWFGRRHRAVALGLGLAVASYLPVSNLIPFNRFIADSYLYLPLAGLAIAATGLADTLMERRPDATTAARAAAAVAVAAILGASWLGWQQTSRWQDHEHLWVPVTEAWPDQAWPWLTLAQGYRFEGRHPEAVAAYQEAFARGYHPQHLSNVAVALVQAGDLDQAECVMVEALRFGPEPGRARHNLALFLSTHPKRPPQRVTAAREALRWAASARDAGSLRWKPEWVAAIAPLLEGLDDRDPSPPAAPARRGCPVLKAPRPDPSGGHD